MRRLFASADAGSASEHGDGQGVTRLDQRIGNRELPTPPSGPRQHPLTCPSRRQRNPRPARLEGSRTRCVRPDRPTGVVQATRRPTTVRGRPLRRVHHCSVVRNGCRSMAGGVGAVRFPDGDGERAAPVGARCPARLAGGCRQGEAVGRGDQAQPSRCATRYHLFARTRSTRARGVVAPSWEQFAPFLAAQRPPGQRRPERPMPSDRLSRARRCRQSCR
jgi:hypothetical protein